MGTTTAFLGMYSQDTLLVWSDWFTESCNWPPSCPSFLVFILWGLFKIIFCLSLFSQLTLYWFLIGPQKEVPPPPPCKTLRYLLNLCVPVSLGLCCKCTVNYGLLKSLGFLDERLDVWSMNFCAGYDPSLETTLWGDAFVSRTCWTCFDLPYRWLLFHLSSSP